MIGENLNALFAFATAHESAIPLGARLGSACLSPPIFAFPLENP
jgi:hypothetical protein